MNCAWQTKYQILQIKNAPVILYSCKCEQTWDSRTSDALHAIRKRISKTLPISQAKELKKNKNRLGRRNDSLNEKEFLVLETLYILITHTD